MKLTISSPSKAYITQADKEELLRLKNLLTYDNISAKFLVKKHYDNRFWRKRDEDGWKNHLEKLKKDVTKTLIFKDEKGAFIRPGSIAHLDHMSVEIENQINYPKTKTIAWQKPLPFELHDYQEVSWKKLLEIRHGNVELTTGSGKSAILLKIVREAGLKVAVIAPSKSIFNELVEKFEYHLGRGKVGTFGAGKKKIGKLITVCIGDSVSNVKEDSPEWDFFSKMDMICVDESHTWGADSLEKICHGVFSEVPYRFFFSATQTRGDGAEVLLQSIVGRTVYALNTQEAVEKGFICPHEFKIVEIESSNPSFYSSDPLEMKRNHFLRNRNIAKFIAKVANADANVNGRQTLVLVDELPQIAMLAKLLTVPFAYAHSESKKERLEDLDLEKVNPKESVDKFNKNEVKVLIGTTCISTGTNIYPTHNTFNWQGGSSEIKTKQGAVGRSVRKNDQNPYKNNCLPKNKALIWDFKVNNVSDMDRHLNSRISYYKDSGSTIQFIKIS